MELFDEKEKTKIKFQQVQVEKNYFLGEFKENVILAVRKQELDGKILREVVEAMKREDAILLKISRNISLKKVKVYIDEAEKIGIKYRLVDGLSFVGDVGLVVVSKLSFNNENKEVILEKRSQPYEDLGLPAYFSQYEGQKICRRHFTMIMDRIPLYTERFDKLDIFDRLMGKKCPICEEERKGKKK
ncbi:DUF1694 domain-containing protein [Fusobacterium sp.]|uniref:DUF1694 domain-containing protein n=1 Tax=Fusobacterium sp. TaxID=68766 RepID=UPI00261125A8|nr:DUF1694 domain-containing protein [Fusobacterium sp.]